MYTVAVRRDFIAQHFLIGGDWGRENELHSHDYRVEVRLEGTTLDRHGYLVDIVAIEDALDEAVARYRDRTLNELPEFEGLNPSLERFASFFLQLLAVSIKDADLTSMSVTLWENELAWASSRHQFDSNPGVTARDATPATDGPGGIGL